MRRPLAWLALGLVLGAGAARAAGDPHFLTLTGEDWRRYGPDERTAWVQGFLAGQAVAGVPDSLRADTTAFAAALERRRREGAFLFPFGVNIYATRLSDYYVWENHRVHPLWRGMVEVNAVVR